MKFFSISFSADNERNEETMQTLRVAEVRRSEIFKDVIKLYSDPSIILCKLSVRFRGESGLDFGGLTADMFSTFWGAAFNSLFEGDVVKIPNVPSKSMAQAKEQFCVIGRIITHEFLLNKKIPVQFCEASFTAALHGEDAVDNDTLLRSFMLYLTQFERDAINAVLSDATSSDLKQECLLGIYERFGMTCCPAKNKEELHQRIVGMARAEFVYKPLQFLLWIRQGMECHPEVALRQKLPLAEVRRLYEALVPNKERVLQSLVHGEYLMPEQSKVLHFLKAYLGSMDDELLQQFVRFVTASTVRLQKSIDVQFTAAVGLQRAPSSSTCSSTLFLPTSYRSYSEFRKEFSLMLNQEDRFEMGHL